MWNRASARRQAAGRDRGRARADVRWRSSTAVPTRAGMFLDAGVGLGIQRLRVIDLETGDQPIYNEDGSVVVVLNGEIYNYAELRARAAPARATASPPKGDTEVIVHLYEEHGADCVRHLHGMFAFALWDSARRRLLARPRPVGKKPLFYAHARRRAELRLRAARAARRTRRSRASSTPPRSTPTCAYGYVPAPQSHLRAVSQAAARPHARAARTGRATIERYWRLDYSAKRAVADPRAARADPRGIRAAMRRRLVADVPLGAFLSGGIDSSAVVAAMAEASSSRSRRSRSASTTTPSTSCPHARRVAERFGTDHHEFVVRADAVEMLPRRSCATTASRSPTPRRSRASTSPS